MSRLRLKEEFGKYRLAVFSPGTPEIQVAECRRAFYAGAHALLNRILAGLEPGAEETDDEMMYEIHTELLEFAQDVKGGRR